MQQEHFETPSNAPQIGAVHTHYKDHSKEYKVTGLSLNSDTDEWHVEYVPLYEGAVANKFNRPLITWLNKVMIEGAEVERYPFVRME